ncbi:hypothetical protein HH212_18800 [Massilia forsythiae]|uniref:PpiC domain-containing protein n=1 Tax=Massilia forsythiae TaxID=2728020 RepID=A0A7Z2VZM7_9BURK|nr:peptidylprolyl isomerase [Massilia forsythiae]QJE01822.1 hypothetical protein HH212_18800 [Massilia forsythiae]
MRVLIDNGGIHYIFSRRRLPGMARKSRPGLGGGSSPGQFRRGECVPEFDTLLSRMQAGEAPQLVETRFGLHIVQMVPHIEGMLAPDDKVPPPCDDRIDFRQFRSDIVAFQITHL